MTYKRYPKGSWMRLQSGDTLRALMNQKGFSMARMGRYADVSQSFIHRLCTGEKRSCKPRTAERIAEALDVPVGLLFVLNESPSVGRIEPKQKIPA